MGTRGDRPAVTAADVLAALSRASIRQGNTAVACTRLVECLSAVPSQGSLRSGAAALHAAAELAAALGEHERAVEFYGACRRILRRAKAPKDPEGSRERKHALERLRDLLGPDRYEVALAASRATPFPFEFYIDKTLHWLESLESRPLPPVMPPAGGEAGQEKAAEVDPGTTARLILAAREGDATAREALATRYLEPLRRFARGRVPARARDLVDTDDLVQVTLIRGLDRVGEFEPRRRGGFFAYLRRILLNQVRDEYRRTSRKPRPAPLTEMILDDATSPLEALVERETFEAYESALARLSPRQREALVLRIEYGFSYQEVADDIGCPSANAARMIVSRALEAVSKAMLKHSSRLS